MPKVASVRFSDLTALAWGGLRRNRLRSSLTIGAIAFGVSVLVYLVALGLGLENLTVGSVLRSSTLLSFNVTTFNKDIKPLNDEAVTQIKEIPEVREVLPRLTLKGEVAFGDKRVPATIVGVDPTYFDYNDKTPVRVGRSFTQGETASMLVTTSFLQLIGLDTTKSPLINFDVHLDSEYGAKSAIPGVVVRGVVDDATAVAVYLPRQYLESLLPETKPDYENIKVIVGDPNATTASDEDINRIEPASAAVIAKGYRVSTVVDTVSEIKRVFSYIQITLAILGIIAIAVASIGMFNTLTVSLLERTKEIGIMKALGIRRRDIRRLFLTEAMLIGLFGGMAGNLLAMFFEQTTYFVFQILAILAEGSVPQLFLNAWYLPVGSMVFSLLIALATGIYPASRAAKLNPIDAIRYE